MLVGVLIVGSRRTGRGRRAGCQGASQEEWGGVRHCGRGVRAATILLAVLPWLFLLLRYLQCMPKHSETSAAAKMCIPTLLQSICQDLQLFPSMRGVGCRGGGRGGNNCKQNFKQSLHNLYTCLCCSAFSHVHSVTHSVTCITCCALVFSCLSVESVNEHCVFHLKSPPAGFESCRVMLHVQGGNQTATETGFWCKHR